MKTTLSVLICVFAVATSSAQEISFHLEPRQPTTTDRVQLTISQMFPTPCYSSRSSVERVGNAFTVEIVSEPVGEVCIQVLAPQVVTLDLGKLEAGAYTVDLVWRGAPSWGSARGQYSFEVAEQPPAIQLDTFKAIGLRFESDAGAHYQVQFSTDLLTWNDFGEPIAGTGGEMLVYDQVEHGPRRFYRVIEVGGP